MMMEVGFKLITKWPGGARPQNWQTEHLWDVLEIVKRKGLTSDLHAQLCAYRDIDLQAAYKTVRQYPGTPKPAWIERDRQLKLLQNAFEEVQVEDVIERNRARIDVAVQAILVAPPPRVAWRSSRTNRLVLAVTSNAAMTYESRIRTLIEYLPANLKKAVSRARSYGTGGGKEGFKPKPEFQALAAARVMILQAALRIQTNDAEQV